MEDVCLRVKRLFARVVKYNCIFFLRTSAVQLLLLVASSTFAVMAAFGFTQVFVVLLVGPGFLTLNADQVN